MKIALNSLAAAAIAVMVGLGSAALALRYPIETDWVRSGAWKTNLEAGSSQAGIYSRGRIAVAGLFALNKSETIYFLAEHDDDGRAMSSRCDYRIEGKDFNARWWSITAYGPTFFLIPNQLNRYSYNMNNLARDAQGNYVIRLSSAPKDMNWLPSGNAPRVYLNLRLYNPDPSTAKDPAAVETPRIIREACR